MVEKANNTISVCGVKDPVESMIDAPCGAMVWTRVFLKEIREIVPDFRYQGIEIVKHVAGAVQADPGLKAPPWCSKFD